MKISPFKPKRLVNHKDLKEACQAEITFLTTPTSTSCLVCCPRLFKPTKGGRYKNLINEDTKVEAVAILNTIISLLIRRQDYYRAIDFNNPKLQDLLSKLFEQVNPSSHAPNDAEGHDFKQKLFNQPPIFFNHSTLNQVQMEAENFLIEKEQIEEQEKRPHIANQAIYRH
ncbi:MAG: hypothetical protein P1U36_00305 [Legionellaceae bacterium]|nr:hypothetical protein [Legionellaceae bacterium]